LGYAAIDLYTCGDTTNTQKAADFLIKECKATTINKKELIRTSYSV
jgi:S-adenosylmethionine/arginine decarboxylase-like enzyme